MQYAKITGNHSSDISFEYVTGLNGHEDIKKEGIKPGIVTIR